MKRILLFISVFLYFITNSFAQLDSAHYLPPLKQGTNNQSIIQQAIYISTPATEGTFNVEVYRGVNAVPSLTFSLSNGSPYIIDSSTTGLSLGNGDNGITLINNASTGTALSTAGLRFVAPGGQKFYVNYRGRSGAQAGSLTSKGKAALGTDFRWGGIANNANNGTLSTSLGIMATDPGTTTVTVFGYDPDCVFREPSGIPASSPDFLTITLQQYETYVIEAPKDATTANIDGWLGATLTSDKKIAISLGGLNVGVRTGSGSRDVGIDQPVPTNVLGRDYVFVRGNGASNNETEFAIIVATQNATDVFAGGVYQGTINNGEYLEVANWSANSAGGNMYIQTSKEAYAYQCLAGLSGRQTLGMNFIAPVNCLLPNILDEVSSIHRIAGVNSNESALTILASTTTPDGNITVTDGNGDFGTLTSTPVAGTADWKTFFINGLTGEVDVTSTGPIAVGTFMSFGSNAGLAGYFSGFDTVPTVELDITGGGCLPGADVVEVTGGFDAYQWFENGVEILGETTNVYTPSEPGDFFVRVTRGTCTYDSAVISVYNCDPELRLTKVVDSSPVLEGDTVTFTATVEHLGVNQVTGLVINDLLPSELTFVSGTPTYGSWIAPDWTIGNMFSGELHTIEIVATVNEVTASTTVTNLISNTQNEVEGDVLVDDDTEDVTIINSEIEVAKVDRASVDGSYDTLGEVITYDFVVTNTGDTALTNITITDPNIDSGSLTPSSVANLAIGASANFTATHTITQADIEAGQVVNSATANATLANGYVISDVSDDPDDTNNAVDDPTITPIEQLGSLEVEKIAQPASDGLYDDLGEVIAYEITVINTGNVSLDNVTVTDANADSGSISPATLPNLPAGASFVFTAQHTIIQADFDNGNVTNTATASGTEPVEGTTISDDSDDPTTAAPDDATLVSIPQFGQLQVTKVDMSAADGAFDTVGEAIVYTIIATSVGNVTLTDINIVDPNADVIVLSSTTGTDADNSDGIVDSMEPTEMATFTVTHFITQEDLDNGKVVNTATVGSLDPNNGSVTDLSDDPDDNTTTDDFSNGITAADPTVTPLISVPSLSVSKVVDDYFNVTEGQTITYTYVVTNDNNVTIDNVSIADVHVADGTITTPALQSTTGIDADNSDNEIDTLAPGETGTWTATYQVTAADISNQADITNTVTATGNAKTGNFVDPTADVTVTVHPIDTICSDEALNHDLTDDNNFVGETYSWSATDNPNVTGETLSISSATLITDTLVNISGLDQIVEYAISVNVGGDINDVYVYQVTVHSQLVVPEDESDVVDCLSDAVEPDAPVVNDSNGSSITPIITSNTDPVCEGDKIYTFTYTDPVCTGNVAVYTFTYTIDMPDGMTIPANGSSTVDCPADATNPGAPATIQDNCGNDVIPTLLTTPSAVACEGAMVWEYEYRDCADNVQVWQYTYTIDMPDGMTIPANGSSTVDCPADATNPGAPATIQDNCGNDVVPTLLTTPSAVACEGAMVWEYEYRDCADNVQVWQYTYTIDMPDGMTIPANGSSTVDCPADATNPGAPATIQDNCGNDVVPTLLTTPSAVACEGAMVWEYEYRDCADNVQVWQYTYTIDMPDGMTIPANGSSTVDCPADATNPGAPATIQDNCGNDVIPTLLTTPSAVACEGAMVWEYEYRDCADNVQVWQYTYTIDMPDGMTIPANGSSTVDCPADATNPGAPATIQDNCGNDVVPTLLTTPSAVACEGAMVWEYEYRDCADNVQVWQYTYTIDMPDGMTIPANGSSTVDCPADATNPGAPATIQDNCGNDVIPTLLTTPSAVACEGAMVWEYEYRDCADNVQVWQYTYTIDMPDGMTIPANGSSTVDCPADATNPGAPATIQDNCGNDVIPTLLTTPSAVACEGAMVWEYEYRDCADNVQVWQYTYTIDMPDGMTIPANGSSTVDCPADATNPGAPATIQDNCGNDVVPTLLTTPTAVACEGTMVWEYEYRDCADNVQVWQYTYTIDMPDGMTIPTNGSSTVDCPADATNPGAPATIQDNCGNDVIPTLLTTPSAVACEGAMVWEYEYRDCADNVQIWQYTYTIDMPDGMTIPTNESSTVDCPADATNPGAPATIQDNCGNDVVPTLLTTPSAVACEGAMVWEYEYRDCADNVQVWQYTYTIDMPDGMTIPANGSSTVDCPADATNPGAPATIQDNCGNDVIPTLLTTPSAVACEGAMVWEYEYRDCADNVQVWQYTYTIDVLTLPVVPTDDSSTVECIADAVQPTAPTVTDVCGNNIIPVITENADPTCEGDKIYTFTYRDCANNVSVYTYTYTIDVSILPVVPANETSTVECIADAVQPATPTVTDVCGNNIVPVITENTDPACEGDKIYTFTYTDCANNVSVYTYTYTVDVSTLPVVPANEASDVECIADAVQPATPTVTDVCGNNIIPVITENTDPACEGDKVYTFTYTDCANNVSVYTYTYTIETTTLPVVPTNDSSTVMDVADATEPIAPVVIDVCGNNIIPVVTENEDPLCDGEKIYTFTYTDCAGNTSVYIYTYTIDVTATLEITDIDVTVCSDVSMDYDLTNLSSLSGVTFTWEIDPNTNVSGAANGSGTIISDAITNTSGVIQNILYNITPFNSDGCEGNTFELLVSVNPEPFVAVLPVDTTCSNIALNHDLSTDVDLSGTTFSWVADENSNVNGETTTVSTANSITDNLINTSGAVQTIIYTITPTSVDGCLGDPYQYIVTVSPEAELVVRKSTLAASDGSYNTVGEVIQYEITVENINEVEVSNVTLADVNADSGSISPLTFNTIPAFGTVTFNASHTITQADLDAGEVVNSAIASGFDPCGTEVSDVSDDPSTTDSNDATVTVLEQTPSMSLEKVVTFNDENADGIPQEGETLTYNFTVSNTGNVSLTNISISDPLITVNGGPIDLAPTGSDATTFFGNYTITQSNIDSGSITNSATVSGNDPKGNQVLDVSDDPNNTANTDVNGDGEPDDATIFNFDEVTMLAVSKTGVFIDANGDGVAQVGETIAYTFDVANTGNVTLYGVSISDPLVTVSGAPITLTPTEIDNTTFTAVYTLTQDDINSGDVSNSATVSGTSQRGAFVSAVSDDPTTSANNDPTFTTLLQDPKLSLLKTSQFNDENGNGFPEVGETVSYSFDVRNTGNVTITNISITDNLVSVNGGPIDLLPNERDDSTFTATYILTLADINSGSVSNSASVSGQDPNGNAVTDTSDDPNNPTNNDVDSDGDPDDDTVTLLASNPKMSVTKIGVFVDENNDGISQVGETISYTFNVVNTGNVTINNITITDALVTVSGGTITLNPTENDDITFTAVYTITQTDIDLGSISNTAVVNGEAPNGSGVTDASDDPTNATDFDANGDGEPDDATVTTLPVQGGISLTKATLPATDGSYDTVGEQIVYTLIVTNTGNVTLTNVSVTDANADNGSIVPAVISSIAPGAGVSLTATHTITQDEINSGLVTNTASVSSTDTFGNVVSDDSDDPNDATDNDTNADGEPDDVTNTIIAQNPSMQLEKNSVFNDENGDGIPQKDETLTYNFSVTNTGNVTLTNILVTDPLVTVNGGPITLMPTEVNNATFYAVYTITQADIDLGSITNSATVNGEDTNGANVTDTSDDPTNATDFDANGDGEPDDATVTALTSNPELSVAKTGVFIDANSDGLAQAGETIQYTFDVSNTGNVTISGITISDPLVSVSGSAITLVPGETDSTTFTAIYVLNQTDVNTGSVENMATASGTDPSGNTITDDSDDPTTSNNNDATVTSLSRDPKLSLYKIGTFNDENADGIPQTGETISYVFDIRNTGNVTIFGITITDPIVSVVGAPIDLNPGQVNNTNFSAVYTIQQSDIDSGNLTNTALAIGQDIDGSTVTDVSDFSDDPDNPTNEDLNGDGDPDDPTVTSLTRNPELTLTKTGTFNDANGNGLSNVGETISYTFEVINSGNVTVTDISISDPLVVVNGAAIDLIPGEIDNATFTAVYTITQFDIDSGSITNAAVVTGEDPDGNDVSDNSDDPNNPTNVDDNNDGNPDDDTVTSLPIEGKISILKEALAATDGSYDSVGEQIAYNITVSNTGNITLTNILITDANADAGSISQANITLLVPGESISVSATHTLTQADLDAGTVSNSANVNATDALGNAVGDISDDPNNMADNDANADGDPDDVTVTNITQSPSISLTKEADLAPDGLWDSVGEVITYVLEVVNTGNVTLTDIVISDINADAGSISPANIATLEPGESMMLGASHTITQSDLDIGSVTNTAVVNAEDPKGGLVTDDSDDPNNTTDSDANGDGEPDDATVTVTPQLAILDVTKAVDFGSYTNIGDVLTYSISVTNAGNVTLLNIILSDANATLTSASTVSSLAPGETFTATAEHLVTVDDIDAGRVVNTAFVDATIVNSTTSVREDSDDPDNATNADVDNDGDPDDATVSIFSGASDLSVEKVVNEAEPVVNDEVVFTITLTNEGSVTANNIVIEEFIPSGYEFISYIATAGTYSENDGEWTVPVLNEGDIQLLEITVEVLGTGDYLNTAAIFSLDGGMDMNTSNNTSTAFVTPQCLEVYNEFSPNSDGDNDLFLISCIENYPNNKLEVYNRWGNIVYQAKGYSNTWDGTSNGRVTINEAKELPVGTYYYVLDLGDGSKPKTGWIYINR